jgi:NAD(P)-dependent dehydrogenase (short-subunit alcohol dehydrogenase family)
MTADPKVETRSWISPPLDGYRTLVTGGGSGIGRAIAIGFAAAGARVAVVGSASGRRSVDQTIEQIAESGQHAIGYTVDIGDDEAVRALVGVAAADLGGLDTVVTAAGVAAPSGLDPAARLSDLSTRQLREVFDINVRGTWSTVRHAVPFLRQSSLSPSAITVSSVAAKRPTHGAYSVSKTAVWMTTRVLAQELAPEGIRVNCVAPGFIDTPLFRRAVEATSGSRVEDFAARVPLGRIGSGAEIASAAIYLASSLASYFTGSVLSPDGGHASVNAGG